MNKVAILRVVNPILFLLFLIQAVTGLVMAFEIPLPVAELHEFNGMAFLVLIAVHLSLNWTWVRANYLKQRKP